MRVKDRFTPAADEFLNGFLFETEETDSHEEEWRYDETEMLWKRNPEYRAVNRILWLDGADRESRLAPGNRFRAVAS